MLNKLKFEKLANKRKKKLINLELDIRKLPINAIASILHRISGVMNIFSLGWMIRRIYSNIKFQEKFSPIIFFNSQSYFYRFLVYIFFIMFIYHILSGIRFILIDLNIIGYKLIAIKISAILVFFITFLLFFLFIYL
ncbi:succinate dehydrogenase, cytochrome b556 subunit [Candidatus Riesia pediculicola]|uniref:Succinate dehydrogenase cytochrome b556 subunit n=1 Tax=Riesia pediculicola (strain USDA) TaxID=515618 RepID=D4G832_RIEPU|nr:succinate dehydrogenase, Cytochrome b556 subunit [Candidatus Riesia pediculicola USDA]ARC53737.1 hypothetical protein AOE55_01020 [Candidatus Riesia pediculicola]ARC54528.1 hypothetical protein AOE56_01095 [Candidatus Riesia pediculicola]QOJ86377.1 succinate dehydrogenase, cytochrome b556 subunit [Candidatus Riesia pediculicola]